MTFILYHSPANPFCRKVRLLLAEKNMPFKTEIVEPWTRPASLLRMNPACEVPVLETPERRHVCGHRPVCEYLNEISTSMYGDYPQDRAETRRLCEWFDENFYNEVNVYLFGEKVTKRLLYNTSPAPQLIRAGKTNLRRHLAYTEWLLQRNEWLAGESISMADLTAAAHFSVLDYIGEIPWDDPQCAVTKKWYMRLKSHPSFKPLLEDRVFGVCPAAHYADLDF